MYCLLAIFLTLMSFAGARSLPNNYSNQQTMGENWRLARREADSDPMVTKYMNEIANLSLSRYLKDLFINLTRSTEMADLSKNTEINKIRSYENQAKSKLNKMLYIKRSLIILYICMYSIFQLIYSIF